MWVQNYKGFIVQGYFDKDVCQVISNNRCIKFKSLLAAKQGISKWINKGWPLPVYVL